MPPAVRPSGPVALVFGDDDHAVKTRAVKIYDEWRTEAGGLDHEIIDASVSNSGEALKALARLRNWRIGRANTNDGVAAGAIDEWKPSSLIS